MFKGKIKIVKNVNGKKEVVEKGFNSPEEYQRFLVENAGMSNMPDPSLTLSEWGALGSFIDQIFEDKMADFIPIEMAEEETPGLPVDIDKYEKEAAKIEEEKEKNKAKKTEIKKAIEKLKAFIKSFEKEGKQDLAKSAKADIEKLGKELKQLK